MIWVIAGTLDGRTLAVEIQKRTGEDVLVTVVSQYGAELAAHKGITVHTGRLDQEAMQNLIKEHNVRLLIDASHPYAAIVTATAQDAAKAEGIPFVRFERKEVPLPNYDKLHIVVDEVEAANLAGKLAKENNNHVYLTTGSKTMHIFAKSEALIKEAHNTIAQEIENAKKDLHNSTLELVAEATGKVLGEKIDAKKDTKLISEALEEAE